MKLSVISSQLFVSKTLFLLLSLHFTQWVGDKVGHNIKTLNGEETFHGMGIIFLSTPSSDATSADIGPMIPLKRLPKVTNDKLLNEHAIPGVMRTK